MRCTTCAYAVFTDFSVASRSVIDPNAEPS
jgi:hypothetical protein